MKRRDLLKKLAEIADERGESFRIEEGGSHSKVWIGRRWQAVPRHAEVNEITAMKIIKRMENPT